VYDLILHAGVPLLFGSPQMFIQCIRSHIPFQKALHCHWERARRSVWFCRQSDGCATKIRETRAEGCHAKWRGLNVSWGMNAK